jgi:uncharacterized protein involved in type VI secretion and phage assembly
MSPKSPAAETGQLSYQIKVDGQAIDDTCQVVSIDTWNAVNTVPRARIALYDGSVSDSTFAISSGATFLPGAAIEVSLGYGGKLNSIFSGIVIGHSIEIPRDSASVLTIEMADSAIRMTVARNTAVSEQKTDSDVIGELIAKHGLSKDVEATTARHEAIVQFDATDWDTLLAHAEMNRMLVTVDAGKVTVKTPDTSGAPALEVEYGESIIHLRAGLDAVSQLAAGAVKSVAWNSVTSPAQLLRSKLAKTCGQVQFRGSPLANTGTMIALAGLGDRFNGNAFISGVHHSVRENAWLTIVDFGLPAGWDAERRPSAFVPAAGHLSPIRGLQSGVVKKIHEDPSGAYRILVTLPLVKADNNSVWARLASLYASNGVGTAFYPEVGDEVIVGFMNEDPRFPVVLGSVYSAKLPPPYMPGEKNKIKGLKTHSKMELTFDDDARIVTVRTPGGHVFVMDDKEGSISVTDSNKNSLVLGKKGIALDSASDITIKATGDISITPTGNLAMTATSNATCEGLQIELKAQSKLSAQGGASAELKSSGLVTVKGSLVQIN